MARLWSLWCLVVLVLSVRAEEEECIEDLEEWEPAKVLSSSDILIYGEFKARYKDHSESKDTHTIILDTHVDCVIYNANDTEIPGHINITETRHGSYNDTENKCVDYMVDDIEFSRDVLIMIEKREDGWGFDVENQQGPWYYEDDVDMIKLMRHCNNINPQLPQGRHIKHCPVIRSLSGRCIDIFDEDDDDMDSSNGTSTIIRPLSGASMAGIMYFYKTLV